MSIIKEMSYGYDTKIRSDRSGYEGYEILAAEMISDATPSERDHDTNVAIPANLDVRLTEVNSQLDRYTCTVQKEEYALSIACGILSGIIDSLLIGKIDLGQKQLDISHRQVNEFIQDYARSRGIENERLKTAISGLEDMFEVAQDNVWKGANISVSAKNHHLADLAHHPTPLGLISAIMVQFFRVGTFVNRKGEIHLLIVETTKKDILKILVPAVMTGVLNWLVFIAENKYEDRTGKDIPNAIKRLAHLVASAPILIEIVKCADNWFGHLVSDMGGSRSTSGRGMGIPGIFVSMLHEMSMLPVLKDSGLPEFVNNIYQKQHIDLRHEIALYKGLEKQALPVIFNEVLTRTIYFISRFISAYNDTKNLNGINWSNVLPFDNRNIDRMIMVSSMTFSVADTTDAAVHAALGSNGDFMTFSMNFVLRYNYIGAGRVALAIVKEVSNEAKEAQLIHEKLLLTEVKTKEVVEKYERYKIELEQRLSGFIAEDISEFMKGFDQMNKGFATGNSDMVIHGNVIIQRVLGREPQFTDQQGFDDLMEQDIPLIL